MLANQTKKTLIETEVKKSDYKLGIGLLVYFVSYYNGTVIMKENILIFRDTCRNVQE